MQRKAAKGSRREGSRRDGSRRDGSQEGRSRQQGGPPLRATQPALTSGHWQLQLLGGLRARSGDMVLLHFPTHAVACLLARLVLQPQRDHSREELAELLWPAPPHTAPLATSVLRNRLRNALHTLRSLLEPPGTGAGQVLLATKRHVRVNPQRVHSDVARFEELCLAAATDPTAGLAARALYRGELLPGYDDDWIHDKRRQLADLYENLHQPLAPTAPPASPHRAASEARLAHPGYAGAAAQRVPQPWTPHRLAAYVTPFFGRAEDLRQLQQLVHQHRLLHLVGPGGCGKTRLSVQWAQLDRHFDSILLVPLQECPTANRVIDHVRAALEVQATGGPAIDQVVDRLQGSKAMLILDSCEHLMPALTAARRSRAGTGPATKTPPGALAPLLVELQRRLPQLHLLLTSRRALHADSPRLSLQPLPLPSVDVSPALALANPCVALFVDRARAVRADFALHTRNVAAVVQVCRLLDGLPVLVEIAASRVRHYPPQALCDGLSTSLGMLQRTGPAAQRAGHHGSVRALLEWSWRHLPPALQTMMGAVTTFRGGWTLPAAAALVPCSLAHCARQLQALAEHHLIYSELDATGQARWQMLGVVREQVQSWVPAAAAAGYRARLREHLLAWAQSLQARHDAFPRAETMNVETALAGALADGDAAAGIKLALALQWPWAAVGASPQVLQLLEELARHLHKQGSPAARGPARTEAALQSLRARLLMHSGQGPAALKAAARARACAGRNKAALGDALLAQTGVLWRLKPDVPSALAAVQQVYRLTRGNAAAQARAAALLGAIVLTSGKNLGQAQKAFAKASTLYTRMADRAGELSVQPGLISCLQAQGLHHEALVQAKLGLEQAQAMGQAEVQLLLINRLSTSHEALRRHRQVVLVNQQQLQLARQHGLAYHQAIAVWNTSLALARLRQARSAAVLMAFAQAWWRRSFGPLGPEDQQQMEDLRSRTSAQLGAATLEQLWAQGATLPLQQGLDMAAQV